MGLFRRNVEVEIDDERERLPKTVPATCLGKSCVNFSGVDCQAYDDLLKADGKSGDVDNPPFRDEASYALYGRVCTGGEKEILVAERAELLKPGVSAMMLIAQGGRFGDLPITFESHIEEEPTAEGL